MVPLLTVSCYHGGPLVPRPPEEHWNLQGNGQPHGNISRHEVRSCQGATIAPQVVRECELATLAHETGQRGTISEAGGLGSLIRKTLGGVFCVL